VLSTLVKFAQQIKIHQSDFNQRLLRKNYKLNLLNKFYCDEKSTIHNYV